MAPKIRKPNRRSVTNIYGKTKKYKGEQESPFPPASYIPKEYNKGEHITVNGITGWKDNKKNPNKLD